MEYSVLKAAIFQNSGIAYLAEMKINQAVERTDNNL